MIGWAKTGFKHLAMQAVPMGGMYELTKISMPSAPKKPIPKQK